MERKPNKVFLNNFVPCNIPILGQTTESPFATAAPPSCNWEITWYWKSVIMLWSTPVVWPLHEPIFTRLTTGFYTTPVAASAFVRPYSVLYYSLLLRSLFLQIRFVCIMSTQQIYNDVSNISEAFGVMQIVYLKRNLVLLAEYPVRCQERFT